MRRYFVEYFLVRGKKKDQCYAVRKLNLISVLFLTFFALVLPSQLMGAISATNYSGTAVNPAGTTFSWSHTVSAGSDGCLVVIILSPAGPTTSTVTYNGTSMTKVATYSTSGVATGEWTVWRLLSPSTGANTVAVTLGSGNWNTCSGAGFSFTGASGVGNTAMNNTAAVGQTTSVTISSNSMIIGSVFAGNNTSATLELPSGTSSTIRYNHSMSNYSWGGVSASLSSGAKTIKGTSTANSVIMAVEVQEAGCASNVKANNTTNLNATGSWACATVPTSTTNATWESTVTGANTTSLGGNVSCLGVVISNPGGLVTINSGSTLSIYSGGIDMSASTQSFTMNCAAALAANQSWTVNTSKTLTAAGVVSGSYGITKAGAGTLTLSGTNTFTGGVTHNAGTININAAAALGTTAGTFTIASGTTIDNTSGGSLTTSSYPLNLRSFTFTGTNNLNFGTGATALAAATTITTSASTLTLGGVVSGGFKLTKAGSGALTLSGTNTFTGGVAHNAGTININAAAALGTTAGTFTIDLGTTIDNTSGGALTTSSYPLNLRSFTFTGTNNLNLGTGATALAAATTITTSASTLTLGGVVSGGFKLTKAGSGALTLSGTNTFTGGVDHNAGTLNIGAAAALGTTAGTFTIASGTTIDNTSGGSLTTSSYPLNIRSFTFTGTNSLNFGTGATALAASSTITTSANTLTLGGVISGVGYTLTKAGAGALTLSGTNTFTGGVTHSAGTLNINAAAALGTTAGTFTLASGTTIDNTSGGSITTSDYPMTINGSFTFTGSSSLNLGAGAKSLGATPTITASANTLTLGGVISGAYGITKAGAGTLVLSGANTYSGTTTVSAGTLQLGAAGVISNSSNVVMNGGTLSTGSGSGYSETVGTLTVSANSIISLGTGSHNLNFAASNGTTWAGGALVRINGWTGSYNGTTGTAGKIYSGSSAELSAAKLSQIYFYKAGGGQYTATQLSDGEIVPTATLPVELVYFKGESGDLVNHLYWLTASEVNSNYFDILRSSNGIDFEIIGNHKAAGYSQDFIQYKFDDLSPLEGINYYKLIEYDFDGSKQSSEIVALVGSSNKIEYLKTYPVPTSDQLNVVFSSLNGGIYYLKLLTMDGKEVYTALLPTMIGDNQFKLNLGSYPAGSYIVKVTDSAGESHSSTVVKSK